MDRFMIDSHKLIYHVERISDWLKDKGVYPIYAEIATSGACNHRCTYCALDYMKYEPRFADTKILKKRISEMAGLGLKSVMYAGEGEPLLHKDITGVVNHTRRSGVDVAITTNGVFMDKEFADSALGSITWIKVSINGARETTYSKIHRAQSGDFAKVLKNMAYAARLRRSENYRCALGTQIVLLPENRQDVTMLARMVKDAGFDYLVVKPYSQHPFSITDRYKNIRYGDYIKLADRLKGYNDKSFSVIFRIRTMKKWDEGVRDYKRCHALPFWTYIDAGGSVWGCSAYLGDERFLCGNIYKDTFKKIWNSGERKKMLAMVKEDIDTKNCRVNCRMDEVNRYLWELKHLPEHVNFI